MSTLFHITTKCVSGVSPVQSGIRASEKGYRATPSYRKTGTFKIFRSGGKPIYSGIFFEDGTHMTYNFNPSNPKLPAGVSEGDQVELWVVGKYEDDEVACDIVVYKGRKFQP
jgi:hypothetical protein